jgi:predicted ATPase
LIVALFFENKPFAIYEEPERNIHPHLISRVVNMLKDASRNNQIIITTHNPQIVKFADIDDLLLISRNNEGYSSISRPSENAEVKEFLEDELGIEELYVDNLLE